MSSFHDTIQALLDSEELWADGMSRWLGMTEAYAAVAAKPLAGNLSERSYSALQGVEFGMKVLHKTTQPLIREEQKLWDTYPELY